MRICDECSAGLFKHRYGQFSAHGREIKQKDLE
jgi:hypothetical protein